MMKRILLFLFFIFTALSTQAGLFDKKPAFLPVDDAFQFSAAKSENQENVIVNWSIAEGVLSLSRENFREAQSRRKCII